MASITSSVLSVADLTELVHQVGVDLEAARGVDDHHVAAEACGLLERPLGHGHRVGGLGVDGDVDLAPEDAQLLDGRGPLEVGSHQQHAETLRLEVAGELPGGGRLPGSLQTREHDHRRRLRAHRELARGAPERLDELLAHDLDDLLAGREALGDLGAERALLHPGDEVADDRDVDVGLEQRESDLARDLVDVLLGQLPLAPEPGEDAVEAVGKCVEHGEPARSGVREVYRRDLPVRARGP
jgi:hypothetical protein